MLSIIDRLGLSPDAFPHSAARISVTAFRETRFALHIATEAL